MGKRTISEDPTILEAVDNLSSMAELEIEEVKVAKKESTDETIRLNVNRWLDPRNEQKSVDSAKSTFKAVRKYLEHIYTKEHKNIQDIEVQRGVRSIIALANEAASKFDECRSVEGTKESIRETHEFRELIDFYENKLLKRFEEVLKSEKDWEEEWSNQEDAADIERRGLKDLESVTRDRDYELFYLTKEDGSRFYNRNLIRHIRLVADFDQLISNVEGDDPLLKVRAIQDKRAQKVTKSLYEGLGSDLDRWIKKAGKYRNDSFIQSVFRAMMALLLTANKHNLLSQTSSKPSVSYFGDFQNYLRLALSNVDYISLIENPPAEIDPFLEHTVELLHKICYLFFTHKDDFDEGLSLLMRIVAKDDKKTENKSHTSSLSLWNELLDYHEHLRSELNKYPSGPLFKVLDIIHAGPPGDFDPIVNDDYPSKNYSLHLGKKHIEVISMACPTKQSFVHKAEIVPEFLGFLRHLKKSNQKVLVVNFQDRTSWKEFARCDILEKCQNNAEFRHELGVITLPRETEFYHQSDTYLKLNDAGEFTQNLLEQFKSEEGCGFFLPKYFKREELFSFAKDVIETIYSQFFGNKEILSRKNRLDFIELFYQLLIYKALELSGASLLIFCAKDGIDQPAIASSTLFALSKIIGGLSTWKEEEKARYTSLVFLPALLARERAVDLRLLNRSISMLSVISGELEMNRSKVIGEMNALLGTSFCEKLSVNWQH